MLNRTVLFSLLTLGGLCLPLPAHGQALVPYVLPLDYDRMAEQGRFLASEAQQLAEFRQFNQALALAQLASQLAPKDGQVLALLGGLYLQTGETDRAITLLEQAKTLAPGDARVLFALGSAYFQKGDYYQSSRHLEQGLKLEPNNPNAHFDLGNSYFKLQRYDQAIDSYSTSVALEPDFWPSLNNIGLVLYEQGKVSEALAKWQAASDLTGNQEPEPKLARAVALYHQEACRVAANVRGDRCQEAFSLGIEALEQDSRYAELPFLELNLWGQRLIGSTQQFFQSPIIKRLLGEL